MSRDVSSCRFGGVDFPLHYELVLCSGHPVLEVLISESTYATTVRTSKRYAGGSKCASLDRGQLDGAIRMDLCVREWFAKLAVFHIVAVVVAIKMKQSGFSIDFGSVSEPWTHMWKL